MQLPSTDPGPAAVEQTGGLSHRELYYGGKWHAPRSETWAETISPATATSLGTVAQADRLDVAQAVDAAQAGFEQWRRTEPIERAKALREAAAIVRRHGPELAWLDAANAGNPIREMIHDAEFAALSLEYFAGLATELKGATHPMGPLALNYTVREPLGVIVRISAYNHPFLFAGMRMGAPLAAGNSLIVKPPEQAPLSSLRLAELIGSLFPPGVFNVLPGGKDCGEALVDHDGVAKVGVIGSVPTGRAVYRKAAEGMKKVALELGGKNALIACADADPSAVATGAVRGMNFTWAGQSCGSTSRAFVHESIYDEVLHRIVEELATLRPGMPTNPDTAMGCLISQAQYDKVMHYIEAAMADGARLVAGGSHPDDPALADGFFVEPTVFAEVEPQMRIAKEEIFGPVLAVFRWSDEQAMMQAVNDTEYGLSASIWTKDLTAAHTMAARIEAGYVWINTSSRHYLGAPFGGYKNSGLGREESIDELFDSSQIKNVHVAL